MRLFTAMTVLVACALLAGGAQAATAVWVIGNNNNSHSEMEQEGGGRNDANFYRDGIDFSGVAGLNGLGVDRTGNPEPLIDNSSIEGFGRALTNGVKNLNVFFDLPAADAAPGTKYRIEAEFFARDGGLGSTVNDIEVYWNNANTAPTTPLATFPGIDAAHTVQVDVTAEDVAAAAGANVISFRKNDSTGGWIVFDQLRLSRVEPSEVFQIGYDDGTQSEFEQEGNTRNDANFYAEAGDYTGVGGANVAGPEPLLNEQSATEGFPRALVPARNELNIFFQLDAQEVSHKMLHFDTDLISLGGGSSHDVEFLFNGEVFWSGTNITGPQSVSVDFYPTTMNVGANVLTARRTGGGTSSPWIQFDYVSLHATIPEPATMLLLGTGLAGLGVRLRRRLRRR